MKERQGQSNQSGSELTRQPVNPTLNAGDIFMPDGPSHTEGQPPQPQEIQEGKQRRGGRRATASAPVGQGPVATKRADADIRFKFNVNNELYGWETSSLDPEQLEEARTKVLAMFGERGIGLTTRGQKAHEEIVKALEENPHDFAKAVVKAIDRLDEEEAKRLIAVDFPSVTNALLAEADNLPQDQKEKIAKRIQALGSKDPMEQGRSLRSISTTIKRLQRENAAKAAAAEAAKTKTTEGDARAEESEQPMQQPQQSRDEQMTEAYKAGLKDKWSNAVPIPDVTRADTRVSIRAYIDKLVDYGVEPDESPEDVRRLIDLVGGGGGQPPAIIPPATGGVGEHEDERPAPPSEEIPQSEQWKRLREVAEEMIFSINNELPRSKREAYYRELVEAGKAENPTAGIETISRLAEKMQNEALSPEEKEELIREMIDKSQQAEGGTPSLEELAAAGSERGSRRNEEGLKEIDRSISHLMGLISKIGTDDENDALGALQQDPDLNAWLNNLVVPDQKLSPEKKAEMRAEAKRKRVEAIGGIINSNLSPDQKKLRLSEIIRSVGITFKDILRRYDTDAYNPVKSALDLGKYIAETHGQDLWGVDGAFPIVDKEGNFHPENIIIWAREQTNTLHTDNANDQISPLGNIHINTGFRDVSLYEMVRVNKQRYMKLGNAVLYDLAEQLLTETWGFGQIRNFSLAYVQTMNQDEKLPEVINQIHARSDLTRGSTFRDLLSMSESFAEKDIRVGEALMFMNDVYYNLPDWEKLVEVLGGEPAKGFSESFERRQPQILAELKGQKAAIVEQATRELEQGGVALGSKNYQALLSEKEKKIFAQRYQMKILDFIEQSGAVTFTRGDFKDAVRVLQHKKDWDAIDDYEGFYDKKTDTFYCHESASPVGDKPSLFDDDGRFNILTFVSNMNFYNYANPSQSMMSLVREVVRLKAAQRNGLTSGIARGEQAKDARREKWNAIVAGNVSHVDDKGHTMTQEEAEAEADRRLLQEIRRAERINIEFAEHLAEQLQRPYGGAARNDVNRRGFDAQTKLFLEPYLARQSAAVRAGPVGVRESLGIWRNVGFDMFTILRTETGFSPNEIFNRIRDLENTPAAQLYQGFRGDVDNLLGLVKEANRAELKSRIGNLPNDQRIAVIEEQIRTEVAQALGVRIQGLPDEERRARIEKEIGKRAKAVMIKEEIGKLKFAGAAEKDGAGNIQTRGFQIFHAQTGGERFNLDELVQWDPVYGVTIDIKKWEEQISDGFIKPIRYLTSTNGGMKYTSSVRYYDAVATADKKNNPGGAPVFVEMTLAEAMFSPEVLREFARYKDYQIEGKSIPMKTVKTPNSSYQTIDFDRLTLEQQNYLNFETDGRLGMGKVAIALNLGAELAHHRHLWKTGYGKRFGYVRTEAFIAALEAMEELVPDPDNPGRMKKVIDEKTGEPKRFFNKKMIDLIRRRGDSKTWKMAMQDIGIDAAPAVGSSILEMFMRFAQASVS